MSKLKYYDPIDGEWKPVYSEAGSNSIVTGEVPSGDIDSSNDEFTTSQAYLPGTLEVFVNGLRQVVNVHYTETSPLSGVFTFDEPPQTNDNITVNYMMSITTTGNADTLDGYHLSGILEAIYPVGAIYIGSPDGTMPALIASIGTWVRVEGMFIVGASDSDTDFDYDDTGGSKTHTHSAGGLHAAFDLTSSYSFATRKNVASWAVGNQSTPAGNQQWGGGSGSRTSAVDVYGLTASASSLPPFKAKYIWERVA